MSRSEPARPAAARRWPRALAWGTWGLAMLSLPAPFLLDRLLRRAGYPYLEQLDAFALGAMAFVPTSVSAATVGVVLALRRPRHPVGWGLLVMGLSAVTINWAPLYALYGHVAEPGAVPAPLHVGQLLGNWVILPACLALVLLLTPTGSPPSPRWRWWARTLAVAVAVNLLTSPFWSERLLGGDEFVGMGPAVPNPLHAPALALPLEFANAIAFFVILIGVVVGAASLVVRFRRARGVERLRLRWVALAVVLVGVAVLSYMAGLVIDHPAGYVGGPVAVVTGMPVLIGAAVLRYRLYDLDRIISRTIAYGLLTVFLGAGYAGMALGLGQVIGSGRSNLAVAGATLAVAAAFQPARRRVQELVDRRFNRRRYDAERTIAAFSGRLRQQTDLDALTVELLSVVDQTVQPARAALWLRSASRSSDHRAEPR